MPSIALKKLDATNFENLLYDLLMLKGLQNVRWRTPGADGGRDIEAEEIFIDIANTQITKKWYVECKKYSSSVDWPTIFKKIAYAESNSADYLLMCTSAKFTPNAVTQTDTWNGKRGHVQVRLWPGHEIEHHLKPFFDLRAKYGIDPAPIPQGMMLQNLSLAVSKSIQTFYGRMVFADAVIDPMIIGAQAIAQLIQQRLEDLERYGCVRTSLADIRSITDYPAISDIECRMDYFAYSALLGYYHAISKDDVCIEIIDELRCDIHLTDSGGTLLRRYKEVFEAILFWGDIEWELAPKTLTLRQRLR